jgi:signal transduction histidine kinase
VNDRVAPAHLWRVLEAQADDIFALYQLVQLLSEAGDPDELIRLALPQLARVADSPYAALFLHVSPDGPQELVAWISSDVVEEIGAQDAAHFRNNDAAAAWFRDACALDEKDCVFLQLDVGRPMPGLLALAAPSRNGFSRHEHHLLATMARELARLLNLALARADVQRRQERVEQMQADFIAAVSHELRTPLALIQAGVDSMKHLPLTAAQREQSVEDIARSTARLRRVVDAILDVSRVEEGRWDLHLQAVELEDVVRRAAGDCEPAELTRLHLDIWPVQVRADPERLQQVVSNLLQNALKYAPPESAVRIRTRSSAVHSVAWLDVRDWGRGIPVEDQPYLFTRFFRARNARESAVPGTGLGLYIARRLMEAQGGAIRLRSSPGVGTSARITLPLWHSTRDTVR